MSFRPMKVLQQLKDWWVIDVGRLIEDVRCLFVGGPLQNRAREDLSHAYVNVYVEGVRASAYLVGHVLAIGIPVYGLYCIWRMVFA